MVDPPNAILLAGGPRGRRVNVGGRSHDIKGEQGPHRGEEKPEQVGVGVMVCNFYSLYPVVRVC